MSLVSNALGRTCVKCYSVVRKAVLHTYSSFSDSTWTHHRMSRAHCVVTQSGGGVTQSGGGVPLVKSAGETTTEKRVANRRIVFMSVMYRFPSADSLLPVPAVYRLRITVWVSLVKGGGQGEKKEREDVTGCWGATSAFSFMWVSEEQRETNATTFSVSLSVSSDRLNHLQSGMWVNSGTVGR